MQPGVKASDLPAQIPTPSLTTHTCVATSEDAQGRPLSILTYVKVTLSVIAS